MSPNVTNWVILETLMFLIKVNIHTYKYAERGEKEQ